MDSEALLVNEMLVFAKVVELRSFAAAARQLGLTTSAVSRSVGRLEAHWGVRLLHRTTRTLSLTELGAEVYAGCAQLAHTARDVHATAGHHADTPRGTVRVTAPVVFGDSWLAAQLPSFRERWPEVARIILSGYADNADIIAAINEWWPGVARNDDEADALGLAAIGAHHLGDPMPFEIKPRHTTGLEKIAWP